MSVAAMTKGLQRAEWLKLRREGIGGSDASAVAGFNRYKSPITIFLEKTSNYMPDEPGEPAYWGNRLEDLVAREFSIRTGLKVQRSNKMYKHPKYPWMLGNVDRLIFDNDRGRGILECKTASAFKAEEWEEDRVPDEYAIQLQHYMAVLGLDYGYFAVLIGGNKFKYMLVERNPGIIDSLIKLESQFWNEHVVPGLAPPIDGSKASADLLNSMYPDSLPASEIDLTSDQAELVKQLKAAKEEAKAAQEYVTLLENQLKAAMQDKELGIFKGDTLVTWKTTTTNRLDTKRLKEEHPEIYEKYINQTSSRRFLVK